MMLHYLTFHYFNGPVFAIALVVVALFNVALVTVILCCAILIFHDLTLAGGNFLRGQLSRHHFNIVIVDILLF